jgi:hypothetical protein
MAPKWSRIRCRGTMANLSIKNVPEALTEALRQRAALNHRSLQGELMAIIERAANDGLPAASDFSLSTQTPRRGPMRRGWKTMEQVYAEHLQRFPKPITRGPMSVDIIRQERDKR